MLEEPPVLQSGGLFSLKELIYIPRLLICRKCSTIEVLPLLSNIELPSQEADPLLMNLVVRHNHTILEIGGAEPEMQVLVVEDKDWGNEKVRAEILGNLKQRHSGFDPEFYALKDTFVLDAGKCFNRHGRPSDGCIDWHDDSKRLTPGDWKKAHVYLCDFCVVSSTVTTKIRLARGDYNRQPGEID